MTTAIVCDNLNHEFGERKGAKKRVALSGLTIEVRPGTIYGLLGPNGAGKTTTVRILTTLIIPTGGRAEVLGHDVVRQPEKVRSNIGVAFGGDKGFFPRLTARENLRYFACLENLAPQTAKTRIELLLERMRLIDRADSRVVTYSAGMKQRLHLARAMLADPAVLFLDEPTVGLDPAVSLDLRNEVKRLRDSGKTIFLTTHYMLEADELCDAIGIVFNGQLIANGPPAEIKKQFGRLKVTECTLRAFDPQLVKQLAASPLIADVEVVERSSFPCLKVFTQETGDVDQVIRSTLGEKIIGDPIVRQQTLEEAYLSIIRTHAAGANGAA